MKRKAVLPIYPDTPVPPEEYRLFAGQGAPVLRSYRLARTSMAVALPSFALLSLYHAGIALALAAAGGTAALFLLRKKYGWKGAAVPFLCALAGVAAGVLFLSPLVKPTEIIQEAYRGF
jgi:hypothetical protein